MGQDDADVVVVGAGLAGLSTALFLGLHGVPALVVDRHPSTSVQPKARGQMPTVMEGLRTAGVADAILAATPPGRAAMTIVISASMAGPVFHSFSAELPDFSRFSAPSGMASQAAAEAALAARAQELGARLDFSTACEALSQDDDGVTVTVRDLERDTVREVRTSYVVAADGHRGGLRELIGIGAHGRGSFEQTTTWRFAADLAELAGEDAVVLHYLQNPQLPGGAGVIVSTDHPGEWVAGMAADPDRDNKTTTAIIRTLVGVGDLELRLLDESTWESAHRVADRFQAGRVLLVGDAAHGMPPTGGQCGNTAMLDGYHLGWKLAAVVRGQAGPGLLATHDTEQRPFAEAVCTWQVANLVVRQRPDLADDSIGEPMDGTTLLFGYVRPDGTAARRFPGGVDPRPAGPALPRAHRSPRRGHRRRDGRGRTGDLAAVLSPRRPDRSRRREHPAVGNRRDRHRPRPPRRHRGLARRQPSRNRRGTAHSPRCVTRRAPRRRGGRSSRERPDPGGPTNAGARPGSLPRRFLDRPAASMPRTASRHAVEHERPAQFAS